MEPKVTISSEARNRLLVLLGEAEGSNPFVVINWLSLAGDISHGPNGETNIVGTPEQGVVQVLSGLDVPADMIVTVDDIPVCVQVRDCRILLLHVSMEGEQLKVERRA